MKFISNRKKKKQINALECPHNASPENAPNSKEMHMHMQQPQLDNPDRDRVHARATQVLRELGGEDMRHETLVYSIRWRARSCVLRMRAMQSGIKGALKPRRVSCHPLRMDLREDAGLVRYGRSGGRQDALKAGIARTPQDIVLWMEESRAVFGDEAISCRGSQTR